MASTRSSAGAPPLTVGRVTVDVAGRRVVASGRELTLTKTQFDLLAHLMHHRGRVCSREELMCDVWGYAVAVGSRTVDVHVAQLRAKLDGALSIGTVRGVGYGVRVPGLPAADTEPL